MAFAFDALTYHHRNQFEKFKLPLHSVMIWITPSFLGMKFNLYPWVYGIYITIGLSGWVTISLIKFNVGKLDRHLGDLSYPIYLFHSGVAVCFLF